jgi:hypothetical protein
LIHGLLICSNTSLVMSGSGQYGSILLIASTLIVYQTFFMTD